MTYIMKKIAIVIPKYGLIGGAEQFASELTEKLSGGRQDEFSRSLKKSDLTEEYS